MNSPVIKPTVGRVLYFYPSANTAEAGFARHANGDGPYAALIAHVWNDGLVNLSVFDANGAAHSRTSVPLWQDPLKEIPQGAFCGWMPYQKGQAAKTEAAEKATVEVPATPQYREPSQRDRLECALVSGAAAHLATDTNAADSIASSIKKVLDVLHPIDVRQQRVPDSVIVALSDMKIPSIALSVVDPGPDSLERAMESKTYQDGTTAFGPAPLPDVSPALWAKPLAKEVPELTVSLSDLGLEREIQANSHHSGCKGERCMASAANGYAHSRECIDEAGEAQGWTPTAEDYAKCGPSAGCCGAAPTDSHASAVLYPAIERAMSELGTLHPAFNFAVNRAFNHLHDAFWSECPAPASAAQKRPEHPSADL